MLIISVCANCIFQQIINMKAHQRLQKVLTALATDQKEIAKKIGKHEVSVSRMVNGVMDPSFDTLVALKKSYPMININYLVSGEGPMFMSVSDLNYANEDQAGYGSPALENILKEFTEVNGALLDFLKANTKPNCRVFSLLINVFYSIKPFNNLLKCFFFLLSDDAFLVIISYKFNFSLFIL